MSACRLRWNMSASDFSRSSGFGTASSSIKPGSVSSIPSPGSTHSSSQAEMKFVSCPGTRPRLALYATFMREDTRVNPGLLVRPSRSSSLFALILQNGQDFTRHEGCSQLMIFSSSWG